MRRILARLLPILAIVLWVDQIRAQGQDTLSGLYFGVDEAAGASIRISPDPGGFQGTFYDPQGASQTFEADKVGDAAEAVLDMDGRTVLLRMAPLPFGAQVSLIPFNAEGSLELDYARSLGFVREGVKLPEKPLDFTAAPRSDCTRVAGNSFLASYQFWDPAGVTNGYLCLPDRFRTLMRMFPAVQLDVIWKLCLAPQADRALAIALRDQGLACPEVRTGIANAQRGGRFDRYKAEVESERQAMQNSVRCADGYLSSKGECERAAAILKQNAISLKTAASVLRRHQ